jgi:selenocysteine lyase/cysteine desulfurase
VSSEAVALALAGKALFVSNGDFYASTVVRLLGHGDDGLVRIGASCYTTMDEIERLLVAVAEVAKQ